LETTTKTAQHEYKWEVFRDQIEKYLRLNTTLKAAKEMEKAIENSITYYKMQLGE
jgi:hypothetical protein